MAFVLVQHLDPKHHSLLTELLSKKTAMRVREVTDGMKVERDHVYVIPPNATMSISNHTLQLRPREESRGLHMPIDLFAESEYPGEEFTDLTAQSAEMLRKSIDLLHCSMSLRCHLVEMGIATALMYAAPYSAAHVFCLRCPREWNSRTTGASSRNPPGQKKTMDVFRVRENGK